jgi:hypothetical protein
LDGACSRERITLYEGRLVEFLDGWSHFRGLGVNERIILKFILETNFENVYCPPLADQEMGFCGLNNEPCKRIIP